MPTIPLPKAGVQPTTPMAADPTTTTITAEHEMPRPSADARSICATMTPMPANHRVTTTEAAKLIGRSQSAVRQAIHRGRLQATNERGHWWIEPDAVIRWDSASRRGPVLIRQPSHERTAGLLAEYYSASVEELARLADLHPGNVRKHLALLAQEGRVVKLADGQWTLTSAADEQGVA